MKYIFTVLLIISFALYISAQTKPVNTMAILNVNVIPINKDGVLGNQTVIIRNGIITQIGDAGKIQSPKNALKIDGRGKFLIPGLWDMHVHLMYTGADSLDFYIKQGVTGIRDMGGDIETVRTWLDKPDVIAPRVVASGPVLESASFLKKVENIEKILKKEGIEPLPDSIENLRKSFAISNQDDVKKAFEYLKRIKADFIKTRSVESREMFLAIAAEAKRLGLPYAGHSPTPMISLEEASNAGQNCFEHLYFYNAALGKLSKTERKRIYAVFVKNGTWIDPTIATEKFRTSPDNEIEPFLNELFSGKLPESMFLPKSLQISFERDWKIRLLEHKIDKVDPSKGERDDYQKNIQYVREMKEAGVNILTGTDTAALGMIPGYSLHDELKLLVEDVGMLPQETLRAATMQAARYLRLTDLYGSVEVGKRADLVLLDANPLENIKNTRKIAGVFSKNKYLPQSMANNK